HTQIITDFFPLLRERGISDEQIQSIMIENPRRFLLGA
ncbi:MAG: phosphotriesterase-related protein, partial [Actinobacteria bacterium]|nr:phosphotriesterase-related protein [Actinomycetota bacterium]